MIATSLIASEMIISQRVQAVESSRQYRANGWHINRCWVKRRALLPNISLTPSFQPQRFIQMDEIMPRGWH
jgi:hypothetical protein